MRSNDRWSICKVYFNNVKAEDIYSSLTTVVFSLTYRPSRNFLISLFFTVVDCWMRAADWDTASMELPCRNNQSIS